MVDNNNDNNNKPPQIPYRRERTPSIVVQSLGLSFNKDSSINESVDDEPEDAHSSTASSNQNLASPSTASDHDTQQQQHDQDDQESSSSSSSPTDQHNKTATSKQLQQQQLIRQSTIAGSTKSPTSPPKSSAALLNNTNRRLSLNINNTRRQSLTVDGIGAFSTGPLASASGNATGSLRNKVALKQGHSLLGWMKLASASKDLSGTNGKTLDVTSDELAKHNTPEDCWVALKGNVYNVSLYLSYHPGGEEELMRGAGQDITDLFEEVHRWVNYETILSKCLVGRYKSDPISVTTSPTNANNKQAKGASSNDPSSVTSNSSKSQNKDPTIANRVPPRRQSIALTVPSPTVYQSLLLNNSLSNSSKQIQQPPTYVITQDKSFIKIKIQELTLSVIRSRNLICDLNDQMELQVSIILSADWLYRVHLKLDQPVGKKIEAQLLSDEGCIVLNLNKKETVIWPKIGSSLDLNDSLCEMSLADKFFRPCKLSSKKQLTHDTFLFEFDIDGLMYIPIGWHVLLREHCEAKKIDPTKDNNGSQGSADDFDYRVYKNYTPVSLDPLDNDGLIDESGFMSKLAFIIKIYPNGVLTPKIDELKLDDSIDISDYQWVDFDIEKIVWNRKHWILLCAGTGFTPMVRVISYLLSQDSDDVKSVHLVFFNKTQKDIIWRHKLDKIEETHKDRFTVEHVLSEEDPKSNWNGARGRITKELVSDKVDGFCPDELYILACGPRGFSQLTTTFVNELNLGDNLFVFHG